MLKALYGIPGIESGLYKCKYLLYYISSLQIFHFYYVSNTRPSDDSRFAKMRSPVPYLNITESRKSSDFSIFGSNKIELKALYLKSLCHKYGLSYVFIS